MTVVNYNQSRIKQFRRCQRQYSFRYDYAKFYPELAGKGKKLEMVPMRKRLPLYRGTWMHALQQALHYQWAGIDKFLITVGDGKNKIDVVAESWRDVHEAMTKVFESLFLEERDELGDLPAECERMFKAYLRFWKDDQDNYSVATLPNGKPAIEFLVAASLEKFGLKDAAFKGRLDTLVEDEEYGGYWIWDAKWVKKVPGTDERMLSPQAPLYVWGLREMYDLDVRGFVFNYGRTKPPAIPRVLKNGTLSVARKMDTDQYTYLRAIKEAHGDKWRRYLPYYKPKLLELKGREGSWFRRERIPIDDERILLSVKEYVATIKDIQRRETRRDYIPRSYFYNCRINCDYHEPCAAEFLGLDIEPLLKAGYQFEGERYGKEDLLAA
jgi:hypothetical protein